MAQRAANEIRALLAEREFSRHTTNAVGPEQLPLLTHKEAFLERMMRTKDDK
jgi:hypothetical protein